MTTRLTGVYVLFETDTREDDAAGLIDAIRRLRGVLDVRPEATDLSQWAAETRARRELRAKLIDLLVEKP
jgi:hypothetical protein